LNGNVGFYSAAKTGTVVGTVIKGTLLIGLIGTVLGAVFAGIGAMMFAFTMPSDPSELAGITGGILAVLGFVFYIGFLLMMGALSFVWITQPIIAHVVDNVALSGAQHLDGIQQRDADAGADADGFADALDIGGAI
jgi:hypothetical protein